MNPVTSWRNHALSLCSPEKPIVLTHPQKNFVYPRFANLSAAELENPAEIFRSKISEGVHEKITLFDSLTTAYRAWVRSLDSTKKYILHNGPVAPELLQALGTDSKFELREMPCEPVEFLLAFPAIENESAGIYFSNPNRVDGFFLPFELNFKLFQDLRIRMRTIPILSDESTSLFTFNQVAPGSLRPAIKADPSLTLVGSVYPVMSPQGPETSWTIQSVNATTVQAGLSVVANTDEVQRALQAFNAFQSRQNKAVEEFSRRMLAVERGLKTLSVHLQKLSLQKKLRVTLWPETGFFLAIEVLPDGMNAPFALQASPGTPAIESWCLSLFEKHGILLVPGTLFGRPREVGLCYAAMINLLDEAGQRMVAAYDPPLTPAEPTI